MIKFIEYLEYNKLGDSIEMLYNTENDMFIAIDHDKVRRVLEVFNDYAKYHGQFITEYKLFDAFFFATKKSLTSRERPQRKV
jgi:hypothetical protein